MRQKLLDLGPVIGHCSEDHNDHGGSEANCPNATARLIDAIIRQMLGTCRSIRSKLSYSAYDIIIRIGNSHLDEVAERAIQDGRNIQNICTEKGTQDVIDLVMRIHLGLVRTNCDVLGVENCIADSILQYIRDFLGMSNIVIKDGLTEMCGRGNDSLSKPSDEDNDSPSKQKDKVNNDSTSEQKNKDKDDYRSKPNGNKTNTKLRLL
jgi:hypothetical protein